MQRTADGLSFAASHFELIRSDPNEHYNYDQTNLRLASVLGQPYSKRFVYFKIDKNPIELSQFSFPSIG